MNALDESMMEKKGESRARTTGLGRGLPVRGIFGLASVTNSTVTTIGPVVEEGHLPGHLPDHLVQVHDPSLGWRQTWQNVQQ